MELSDAQIQRYREYGYLIIDNVLDSGRLARYHRRIDELLAEARFLKQSNEHFDLEVGHNPDTPRIGRIKTPHKFYAEFRELTRDPIIIGALKHLIGPNIRLYDSKLNIERPGEGAPVEWHQDWAFYPHTNEAMLAVGVLFDDTDEENGAILVIPQSHRGPLYDHHINGVFSGAINRAKCDVDFSVAVPLAAKAGSITVHHTRLIHGSGPNLSSRTRRLLLIELVAADAWPLMGLPADLDEFNSRIVAGSPTLVPRMEEVPVRIPLPEASGPQRETVYQYHRMLKDRYFEWPKNHVSRTQ